MTTYGLCGKASGANSSDVSAARGEDQRWMMDRSMMNGVMVVLSDDGS